MKRETLRFFCIAGMKPAALLVTASCWLHAGAASAQGAAVVMPLSKAVLSAEEAITFFIYNRIDDVLDLQYTPKCDIDGANQDGQICLDTFKVACDGKMDDNNVVEIAKDGALRCEVRLVNPKVRFALFKPLFAPIVKNAAGKPGSVGFTFSYQPGYLFLLKPVAEHFSHVKFDTYAVENARRARFRISLKELTEPQVISFSAKILDKKSKKVLRFVRLASDKIADPKREHLELEDNFADATDKSDVCYQAFIENKSSKDFYSISDCG